MSPPLCPWIFDSKNVPHMMTYAMIITFIRRYPKSINSELGKFQFSEARNHQKSWNSNSFPVFQAFRAWQGTLLALALDQDICELVVSTNYAARRFSFATATLCMSQLWVLYLEWLTITIQRCLCNEFSTGDVAPSAHLIKSNQIQLDYQHQCSGLRSITLNSW